MSFFEKFMAIRYKNKKKLVNYLQQERGDSNFLNGFDLKKTLFEGFLKKVTPSARHLMLIFYIIQRYLDIKKLKDRSKVVPRIIFMGGISRPGDRLHLLVIKLIISISQRLELDKDTNKYLRVYFLPNYTTSKEYWYVPALDLNEQLTLPGKQACST